MSEGRRVRHAKYQATYQPLMEFKTGGGNQMNYNSYQQHQAMQEFQKCLEDSVNKIQSLGESEFLKDCRRRCPGGGDSEGICYRVPSSDCTLTPSLLERNLDEVASEQRIHFPKSAVFNHDGFSPLFSEATDLSSLVDIDLEFADGHDLKPYTGSIFPPLAHPLLEAIPWTHQLPSFPEKMFRWQTWGKSEEIINSLSKVVIPTAIFTLLFSFFRKQLQ